VSWLERPGDDFPYYNSRPVGLSGVQWILVMIAVAVGFAALLFAGGIFRGPVLGFVPMLLYVAIPLAVLARVSEGHWKALFKRVGFGDVGLMVLFAILNIIVTLVVGFALRTMTEMTANEAVSGLASQSTMDVALFYLRAIPQLLGEELMTILPFLTLLYLFAGRMKMGRGTAILLAWVLTGVLFAAEHIHTYHWNVVRSAGWGSRDWS
jgi:CAAX protease family protein